MTINSKFHAQYLKQRDAGHPMSSSAVVARRVSDIKISEAWDSAVQIEFSRSMAAMMLDGKHPKIEPLKFFMDCKDTDSKLYTVNNRFYNLDKVVNAHLIREDLYYQEKGTQPSEGGGIDDTSTSSSATYPGASYSGGSGRAGENVTGAVESSSDSSSEDEIAETKPASTQKKSYDKRREQKARYGKSDKGKAAKKAYRQRDTGKASKALERLRLKVRRNMAVNILNQLAESEPTKYTSIICTQFKAKYAIYKKGIPEELQRYFGPIAEKAKQEEKNIYEQLGAEVYKNHYEPLFPSQKKHGIT